LGVLGVLNTNDAALYPVGPSPRLPDITSEVIRTLRMVDASSTTTILSGMAQEEICQWESSGF
jgi:hypothetical protein